MALTKTGNAALSMAARGWHVFPVEQRGKKPLVAWRDWSTADPGRITTAWDNSDLNVGIDCGKSGLAVIDVDDLDGLAELESVVGTLPPTTVARTGSGGLHYIYLAPDQTLRNSASKLAAGIDVRADGGYIVAPPSTHPNGTAYTWEVRVPPAPFPQAVLDYLTHLDAKPPAPEPAPSDTLVRGIDALLVDTMCDRWGRKVLEGELAKVYAAVEGTRNRTLYGAACKVFEAVKGGHIDQSYAFDTLHGAGTHIGLDSDEVDASLDSAFDKVGPRHPETPLKQAAPAPVTAGPTMQQQQVEARRTSGFAVMSRSDLATLPPPKWLIDGLVPEGMTWLVGEPGVGKTFVALDWALTVAAQTSRPVLYFAGEGLHGLRLRVEAWEKAYPDLNTDTFYTVPQCPNLVDPATVHLLDAAIQTLPAAPVLIVVDTLARALVGGDENSASDVGVAIDTLDRIRLEHGTSALVLHHTTKAGDTPRGSSAINGAADALYMLKREDQAANIRGFGLYSQKMKDAEQPDPIYGSLKRVGESAVAHPPVQWHKTGSPYAHLDAPPLPRRMVDGVPI